MPAGGPGDEPLVDILHWRRPVYSQSVDVLVAELAELWDVPRLEEFLRKHRILWMERTPSRLERAESVLATKRDELYASALERGWDMESLDERIAAQRRAIANAWGKGAT